MMQMNAQHDGKVNDSSPFSKQSTPGDTHVRTLEDNLFAKKDIGGDFMEWMTGEMRPLKDEKEMKTKRIFPIQGSLSRHFYNPDLNIKASGIHGKLSLMLNLDAPRIYEIKIPHRNLAEYKIENRVKLSGRIREL